MRVARSRDKVDRKIEKEKGRERKGVLVERNCERKGGYYSRMKKERRMAREDTIRQLEER